MELSELKDRICSAFHGSEEELSRLLELFEQDHSSFPFNEYELLLTQMISQGAMTLEEYQEIRAEYLSRNPNLWLFELSAPRAFGERYAQTLLQTMNGKLLTPSKTLDPNSHGQYDLWLDGITIEVKASRVTDLDSDAPLYKKALSYRTKKNFLMNFQQLKPQCCDVFVWLAVYRDRTTIWVMNSKEVAAHPDYSQGQHRGNHGNEGQLHITQENIHTLDRYLIDGAEIENAIRSAAARAGYK